MSGRLSVVATPIGCLEDITLRALRVLREADVILAEDTRHTRVLCSKHAVETPLRSFHAHSSEAKLSATVEALVAGAHYALVSDAGTPLVSDPGANLVARAASAGVVVEAIPGPSAVLAALSVAGLPIGRFAFEGFIPRKGKDRRKALERIGASEATVVLFESPRRIRATLEELDQHIGDERRVALCRELTKVHEETIRGTARQVLDLLSESVKGEVTLVIEGRPHGRAERETVDLEALVVRWQAEGLSTKSMAQRLQDDFGWKRNEAYQSVLDLLSAND